MVTLELEERLLFLPLATPCSDQAILPFLRQKAEVNSGSRCSFRKPEAGIGEAAWEPAL